MSWIIVFCLKSVSKITLCVWKKRRGCKNIIITTKLVKKIIIIVILVVLKVQEIFHGGISSEATFSPKLPFIKLFFF